MINLDYKSGKSIHEQIQDGIKKLIMTGILKENEQLPSVRDFSLTLTVNPNTVQKAYKELESNGIIYSVKGKGNFVSKLHVDERSVNKLLESVSEAVRELKFLGVEKSRIDTVLCEIYKQEEERHD